MIKPQCIDHIVLRTDCYQRLIRFYCDVLGCELERDRSKELGLTQLRAGGSLIDIVDINGSLGKQGGPAPQQKGNNLDHFCLQIAPISEDDLVTHLRQQGVEVDEFQQRYGAQGLGRSLYIRDIAGNTVELRTTVTTRD